MLHHQRKCIAYTCSITNALTSTMIQTAVNTFVAGIPQTMGIVLQPYFSSPSISSISFITSLINEMMKAKLAYTIANLNNLEILRLKTVSALTLTVTGK